MTTPMGGPFGGPRVPDLGALGQQAEMEKAVAEGKIPMPMHFIPFIQVFGQMLEQLQGIRSLLMPDEVQNHVPAVDPIILPDSTVTVGYGVYCLGCTIAAGTYVNPCQIAPPDSITIREWPASPVLVPATEDYLQSLPAMQPQGVPDEPPVDEG